MATTIDVTEGPPPASPIKKSKRVPRLRGWVTSQEAATMLGISRSACHRLFQEGRFRTMHAIGERPMHIVREEEVKALKKLVKNKTGPWGPYFTELRKIPLDQLGIEKKANGSKA